MKKRIVLALLLCLAMCISMFMVGCNDNSGDKGNDNGVNQPENPDNGDDKNPGEGNQNPGNGDDEGENKPEDTKIYFNVKFVDVAGNPIKGVIAGVCIGESCGNGVLSGDDGISKITHNDLTMDTTGINLNIIRVPEGFVKPDGYVSISIDQLDVTITLEKTE